MKCAVRLGGATVIAALIGVLAYLGPHGAGLAMSRLLDLNGPAYADSTATAHTLTGGDAFSPVIGLPAAEVVAIGSSPLEATGETWAYGYLGAAPIEIGGQSYGEQYALLENTGAGWQVVPLPPGAEGKPLSGRQATFPAELGALGGQATASGGVVLLTGGGIVIRDPGGEPQLIPAPAVAEAASIGKSNATTSTSDTVSKTATTTSANTGETATTTAETTSTTATTGGGATAAEKPALGAVRQAGETLPPSSPEGASTPYSAVDETSGLTGVLIAPYHDGTSSGHPGVLHYDGREWAREPIELNKSEPGFTPLALSCSGTSSQPQIDAPSNCWLLANSQVTHENGEVTTRLELYRRKATSEGDGYDWSAEPVAGGMLGDQGEESTLGGVGKLLIKGLAPGAQMLTATSQGVWVDFVAQINGAGPAGSTDVSELVLPGGTSASVAGTWCYPVGAGCSSGSLGAGLPTKYRSFAWPGSSTSDPGSRIITGLPDRAMLELANGSFSYSVGPGGKPGRAPGGAAFSSPQQGWIADGVETFEAGFDGGGQPQAIEVAANPDGDQLQAESAPFRQPLLAVVGAPNTTPGDPGAQALAVGLEGEIGHYLPGEGWQSESLYNAAGEVETGNLRGVAWPEPGRAYAVGDNGTMGLWRAETGLWETDPARPVNLIANLTGIAFDPSKPGLGYAVGKQGTMLKFGKTWTQTPLPTELQQANFTSIAFAGNEAVATYRVVETESSGRQVEAGGVAVEEAGTGQDWHVDSNAAALLTQLPSASDTVLAKVSGLPDGGAVAAGPGLVIERESPGDPWRFSTEPLPAAQGISALAAYREGSGALRAMVSVDLDPYLDPDRYPGQLESSPFKGDVPVSTGIGSPPVLPPPDPLPDSGYVLRETTGGWEDIEHQTLPIDLGKDLPARPDPVLALAVNAAGTSGVAVGGQTGDFQGAGAEPLDETAAVMRFPLASAAGTSVPAPVPTTAGEASFAVGGDATCSTYCAADADDGLGPDVWLTHALQSASRIGGSSGGLRAFLYTGGRIGSAEPRGSTAIAEAEAKEAYERELARFADLLSSGGSLPVLNAASSDMTAAGSGLLDSLLAPFGPSGGTPYYVYRSTGSSGGPVEIIVLDYSSGSLGPTQQNWLREQLTRASLEHVPAVVVGNDSLGFHLPDSSNSHVNEALDNSEVAAILVQPHASASAYFYDYPGANAQSRIGSGGHSIPEFGTGTLGYTGIAGPQQADYLGSSAFLLAEVATGERNPETNVAPVTVRAVPNISRLSLNAANGVYLRRSQVALFEGLARRPAGGVSVTQGGSSPVLAGPKAYDPIPFNCQGLNCTDDVPLDYTFSSSRTDIGNFVAHEAGSGDPRQVELGSNELPVPDEHSGLFCAYNAGTTVVTITAGGLSYSEPVTVQGGSVEYPCGTVPLKNPPAAEAPTEAEVPSPELPGTGPAGTANPHVEVAVPPAPAPALPHSHLPVPRVSAVPPLQFFPLLQPIAGIPPAIVPPPAPPVARPTPPSGTSQVSQTMGAPEEKREEESATELASSEFSAYDPNQRRGPGPWSLVLVILAAGAGVGIRGGRRASRRRAPALARAGSRDGRPPSN